MDHRDSNLPDALCTNRGCSAGGSAPSDTRCGNGTHPSNAISWHPLHMPREKVSGRSLNALNCAIRDSLKRIEPAQPWYSTAQRKRGREEGRGRRGLAGEGLNERVIEIVCEGNV